MGWPDAASQEVLKGSSIKPKVSHMSPPRWAWIFPWGDAWQNGFQKLTLWTLTWSQPGFSCLPPVLPTSSVSRLCTAPSYSTLSHPPSPLLLFRGVLQGASPLPDRALCQSSPRWLPFPVHKTSPVYSIFLGKHLYKDSKSLHVHISINRLTESALRGSFTSSVEVFNRIYIRRCFLKSVHLINILSPCINVKARR